MNYPKLWLLSIEKVSQCAVHDISANVEHQVAELEKRMPALMSGPSCPMDIPFGCKCTYKTGCKFYVDNPRLKR
jgi:hypothetical protein